MKQLVLPLEDVEADAMECALLRPLVTWIGIDWGFAEQLHVELPRIPSLPSLPSYWDMYSTIFDTCEQQPDARALYLAEEVRTRRRSGSWVQLLLPLYAERSSVAVSTRQRESLAALLSTRVKLGPESKEYFYEVFKYRL